MKLPKIETLVIAVFLVCVGLWGASKCSARRAALPHATQDLSEDAEDRPTRPDSATLRRTLAPPAIQPTVAAPTTVVSPSLQPAVPNANSAKSAPVKAPTISTTPPAGADGKTTLYVTIDGLKVHKEPGLKSETVDKLELYEPVTFLNKKTEWTQEVSLGYEKVTDHWVKIRSRAGKEGWVFGAGVHYYKMKRKGVMD